MATHKCYRVFWKVITEGLKKFSVRLMRGKSWSFGEADFRL